MLSQSYVKSKSCYGRRKPARDRLIDSCFISPSPVKETQTIEMCQDTVVELFEALELEEQENTAGVVTRHDKGEQKSSKSGKSTIVGRPRKDNALGPLNPNERRAVRLSSGSPGKLTGKKGSVAKSVQPGLIEQTLPQPVTVSDLPEQSRSTDAAEDGSVPAVHKTRTSRKTKDDELVEEVANLRLNSKPSRTKQQRPRKAPQPAVISHAASTPEIINHAKSLLKLCNDNYTQSSPLCFQAWADSVSTYFDIKKIAEASYGEVFRLALRPSVQTTFTKADESVLKLIALKAPPSTTALTKAQKEKQNCMSAVDHVASEVRLLKRMSPVPGFTNFRDVKVVQGRLPKQFCAAWKYYHENVKESLFPDPSKKTAYDETQLWAVVEMQDAGTDLESALELEPAEEDEVGYAEKRWLSISVWAGWDVFWHVACAVAKGEGWAAFEHRDLHLGNICIRTGSEEGLESQLIASYSTTTSNPTHKLGFTHLEATIIDYTLSRADMNLDPGGNEDIAYLNVSADPAIFEGDGEADYQYDMYRHMRGQVLFNDPTMTSAKLSARRGRKPKSTKTTTQQQEQGQAESSATPDEAWRAYHPATNLLWLHFILYQLMTVIEPPTSLASGQDFELATKLYERLTLLNEQKMTMECLKEKEWSSTSDLVAWAVQEGWLDEEDVMGAGCGGQESQ